MGRGIAFALSMCAASVLSYSADASERIACVQTQLNSLGYTAGPVDGEIHTKARTAARTAFGDLGDQVTLPLPFDDRRAGQWCRSLGLYDPKLQAAWPSQSPIQIYTDVADGEYKRALLSGAQMTARRFFKDQFDVVLSGSFALVGTDDFEQANTLLNTALTERGAKPRKKPLGVDKICKGRKMGAAANRDFIAMCWRKPDSYDAAWEAKTTPRLTSILVHELMHQAQYELAIDNPARRLFDNKDWLLGPSWMIEGSAEVIEAMFLDPDASAGDGTTLFKMQKPARRARIILSDLHKSGTVNNAPAYGTARFAAFVLAQRHGVKSLFYYFEALGQTDDRDVAFEQVFGQTLLSFEAEFEELRRDFGAARDYIKKDG